MSGLIACGPGGKVESTETGGSSGAESTTTGGPSSGEASTTGDVDGNETAPDTESSSDSWDGTNGPDEELSCDEMTAAVTKRITAAPRCELLLQIDAAGVLTLWHPNCGEVPAEPAFTAETAFEEIAYFEGGQLLGAGESPFVIYQPAAGPDPGGLAIVSNHLGTRVFEETIEIAQPTVWTPLAWQLASRAGVGEGCGAPFVLDATSHDLLADPVNPPPLGPADQKLLGDAIADSVLPAALATVVVERAVALAYVEKAGQPGPSFLVLLETSTP